MRVCNMARQLELSRLKRHKVCEEELVQTMDMLI